MANLKEKGAHTSWRAERFTGIGHGVARSGEVYAKDICNLRVRADESLCRRDGYAPIAVFDEAVRGAYYHESNGEGWLYMVAGDRVFSMRYGEGGSLREIGVCASSQGSVEFCEVGGTVILMDGTGMMQLAPTAARAIVPYVPLYGDGWTSLNAGEVHQPRNLLTDRVRIRYVLESNTVQLRLHMVADSLDLVRIDGKIAEGWRHDTVNTALEFGRTVYAGSVIDVVMTLPTANEAQRAAFAGCRMAIRLQDVAESDMLFGGGADGGALYRTKAVSSADWARCCELVPEAVPLYLLDEGCLHVGDGIHGITAMARQYDRVLLFTEAHTLMTDSERMERENLGLLTINATLGCTAPNGAVAVGNRPISICGRSLLRWTANTDEADECNAQVISAPIAELLTQRHARGGRLLYDRGRGEVWLYLPGEAARVWLWNEQQDCFFSYEGIDPDGMLLCGEDVVFRRGKAVYAFSSEARGDTDAEGLLHPIAFCWESHVLPTEHPGRLLRVGQVMLCAEGERGQAVEISAKTERGRDTAVCISLTGETPCEAVRRMDAGRLRHLRLYVRGECCGAFRLLALGLTLRR